MSNIGACFEFGFGVVKDKTKAFEWYMRAAEMGQAGAMNDLGVFFGNGVGVEKDETKAAE